MNQSNKLLSEIVAFRTYARFLAHLGRRETLEETINRNMVMHLDRFPKLSKEIIKAYSKVHGLKAMPSMRALQFSGEAILKNNARQYNCSFANIDDVETFNEILFLLLSGVGVGFSVQSRHISKLGHVQRPCEEGVYVIQDSIAGWADAVKALMQAYFYRRIRPIFDLSNIRAKGSYLVTTGAKAPGPEPLKAMLQQLEEKLKAAVGRKLTSIEVYDIVCLISDAVLAGGVRRSALICLFDKDDHAMLNAKSGEWWVKHPYRARSNNSAVLIRNQTTKEEFLRVYKACQNSGAGEPGISWTNDPDMGFNPCHEIALTSNGFCNLSTINQTDLKDKRDYLSRVHAAAFIGTLQASYTDFPYLRPRWKEVTEKEALLGVSSTGIADSGLIIGPEALEEAAALVLDVNAKYAAKIGINPAARATAIKPEGTSSTVLGSASGIHARHSAHYLRRIRMNKNDALAQYLMSVIPDLVEDDVTSANGVVITIPQESPKGAILRQNETAIDLFKRVLRYNKHWVHPGHREGVNKHNVSATLSVKPEEWDELGEMMWKHRHDYSGVALLPFDGGNYRQAPFEDCSKETFDKYSKLVKDINLKEVREDDDKTERMEQLACAGGLCTLDV